MLITAAPKKIILHRDVYTHYPRAADTLEHVLKRVSLCRTVNCVVLCKIQITKAKISQSGCQLFRACGHKDASLQFAL